MNLHEPERKRVLIPADGTRYPTPHTWVETRQCVIAADPKNPRSKPQHAWEHIFRCDVTGRHRRYGLDRIGSMVAN